MIYEEGKTQYRGYGCYERAIAEKIPKKCSKCEWTEKYSAIRTGPWIIKRCPSALGTGIALECPKCKNIIDITPYDHW